MSRRKTLTKARIEALRLVNGLEVDASGTYAPLTHSHVQSDVSGLVSALAGKASSAHTHAMSDVTSLVSTLSGKSDIGHDHDDRYYTDSEVDALLGAKADTSHTHAGSAITSGTVAAARLPTLDAITAPVAAVSFGQQQATSFVIENRTSDPGSPVAGQLWLRTDL